jgi:DNA polymerase III subunit epsilon
MSNNLFFYDTETTGFPEYSKPSGDPCQPHIVQLAAKIIDSATRIDHGSMNVIIKPDDWVIPAEVTAIHGITTERAMDEGIPAKQALDQFLELWKPSEGMLRRVAHNQSFDARMVRIALHRHGYDELTNVLWKGGAALCTGNMSKPILKIGATEKMKAAKFTGSKMPKLSEAYEFFTGKEMEGAHDAMNDVDACIAVYFGCQDYAESQKQEAA